MGRIEINNRGRVHGAAARRSERAGTAADRTTFVTFSGPVSIPGKTLPAGTYTFRLADSPADRHIVQIFDQDQTKLFATLLAVAAERNQAEGDPVMTFRETPPIARPRSATGTTPVRSPATSSSIRRARP